MFPSRERKSKERHMPLVTEKSVDDVSQRQQDVKNISVNFSMVNDTINDSHLHQEASRSKQRTFIQKKPLTQYMKQLTKTASRSDLKQNLNFTLTKHPSNSQLARPAVFSPSNSQLTRPTAFSPTISQHIQNTVQSPLDQSLQLRNTVLSTLENQDSGNAPLKSDT